VNRRAGAVRTGWLVREHAAIVVAWIEGVRAFAWMVMS